MNRFTMFLGVAAVLLLASAAGAQPFNGGGSTGFDPEVGVVQSGALLDARATVSHDRRYVTITTGATNTRLRDLVLFPVQVLDNGGFVGGIGGGAGGGGGVAGGGGGSPTGGGARAGAGGAVANNSPTDISNRNSILNRRGMFLLAPLE